MSLQNWAGADPMVVERVDLGEVDYRPTMAAMDGWRAQRVAGSAPDRLFLLSHPPVVTYTPRTDLADLPPPELVELIETDRGGHATYHGPGQLIGYLVVGLAERGPVDVVRWVEEALITACATLGFEVVRRETPKGAASLVGVWTPQNEKVASIGMRIRDRVTSHGFALNVDPDMTIFERFTACELPNVRMVSLAQLARRRGEPPPSFQAASDAVAAAFGTTLPGTTLPGSILPDYVGQAAVDLRSGQ